MRLRRATGRVSVAASKTYWSLTTLRGLEVLASVTSRETKPVGA